ncbi:MAG: histidinol dehydrogenase [Promethearchaeota archaeon]
MDALQIISSEEIAEKTLTHYLPRIEQDFEDIKQDVINIINQVKTYGDKAVLEYTRKFDHVDLERAQIKISLKELQDVWESVDAQLFKAIQYAKENLLKFHRAQMKEDWTIEIVKGVKAGQIYRPLDSVGIYVPGGKAIYPSTVLMTAIPALVAGVKNVILCSPPSFHGTIAPEILATAKECNISQIYKIGGVQAIAAMAFGTETIPPVQKIIGPGNKWVNAAKQLLSNVVAIDTPAGPSEILIIADENANLDHVMIDFLSQIEHDPDNIGILISLSEKLTINFKNKISLVVEQSERKEIIKSSLKNSLIINAKNIEEAIRVANLIAPEHLELLIANYDAVLDKIMNAGAVFLGPYSPVPLGDYCAGTNHVLPTGGNAKKFSGLNTLQFLKIIDTLECNLTGLEELSHSAIKLAEFEGLSLHKEAILKRLKEKNKFK